MPIGHLCLSDIQSDPWTAIRIPIPAGVGLDNLYRLRDAADYCAAQAAFLMEAARAGTYASLGFLSGANSPRAHEEFEQDWHTAQRRSEELSRCIASIEDGRRA
jgi:hypothetical protein